MKSIDEADRYQRPIFVLSWQNALIIEVRPYYAIGFRKTVGTLCLIARH